MSEEFEQTRNEIIRSALSKCRVGAVGEDLGAEDINICATELNAIIKFWQTQGFHIWKLPEATLFLRKGQNTYELGTDDVYCSNEIKETHLKFNAFTGQNKVYLEKVPSVGDYIGFTLCCGGIFFTKVTNVEDYLVTIEDTLPKNACYEDKVYFYTHNINKPLKILQARREGETCIQMNYLEQEQFFKLVNIEEEGTPLNYTYMPKIKSGTLKVWHSPNDNHTLMKFIYEQEFSVFEVSKDTPDIPSEWIEPLVWELAYRVSANYGLGLDEREWLKAQAKETLEQAKTFDQETGSFYVYPAQYRGAF